MLGSEQAPDARRALLSGLIDYAGLFPPAQVSMTEAVANYAAYRRGPDAWRLGRFVVPVARLDEFAAAATPHFDGTPWPVSVLAGAGDFETLRTFNERMVGRAVVDAIEAKAETVGQIAALAPLVELGAVYVELPVDPEPDQLLLAVLAWDLRAKIRTGGLVQDAFPKPEHVVRFLAACALHLVPFKATAGLHHPLRGEYPLTYAPDAPHGTMYGYLNVFLVALFLRFGMTEQDALQLLEERDASAIAIAADGVRWRGHFLSAARIAAARSFLATSFGSCSFREPVDDLSALALS